MPGTHTENKEGNYFIALRLGGYLLVRNGLAFLTDTEGNSSVLNSVEGISYLRIPVSQEISSFHSHIQPLPRLKATIRGLSQARF